MTWTRCWEYSPVPSLPTMHQTSIRVRWGELDPYNHVNHAVYSSYLEHARVEALEDLGSTMNKLGESGIKIVVVRSDVRFRSPATAGDLLTVTTSVKEMKGATMTWHQEIRREDTLVVEADITAACVGAAGRAIRIPDELRTALSDSI